MILFYGIVVNLIFINLSTIGIDMGCHYYERDLGLNTTINYTDTSDSSLREFRGNIFDVAFNRCDNIPAWIFWIFEVPFLIGLAYIVRAFVGAT